jgi:hypothetical protein
VPQDEPPSLPHIAPLAFSPTLEADIRQAFVLRCGHEPTDEELRVYRQFVWAITIAIDAMRRNEHRSAPEDVSS